MIIAVPLELSIYTKAFFLLTTNIEICVDEPMATPKDISCQRDGTTPMSEIQYHQKILKMSAHCVYTCVISLGGVLGPGYMHGSAPCQHERKLQKNHINAAKSSSARMHKRFSIHYGITYQFIFQSKHYCTCMFCCIPNNW